MNNAKNKTVENTFLLAFIIIGILGAFYFLNGNDAGQENSIEQLRREIGMEQMEELKLGAGIDRSEEVTQLVISGLMETGLPLHFEVDQLKKDVKYVLDLGNGEQITLKKKQVSYVYKDSGNYNIRLSMISEGRAKILYQKEVKITPSADLAEASF